MFKRIVLLGIVLCMTLAASLAMAAPDPLFNWTKTPITLTFYGQSTFVFAHGETRLIIDPWLTGNPWKVAGADDIDAQYILVSHAHGDHIGDAAGIAKRTGAKVISTSEITRMLAG